MVDNRTPRHWTKYAYPSLKPIAGWYKDLNERVAFFTAWQALEAKPRCYWLSAFFFPQGFITSVIQNYCRTFRIPINIVSLSFKVSPIMDPEGAHQPDSGVLVYGLYTEACKLEPIKGLLEDCQAGEMVYPSPMIQVIPLENYTPSPLNYMMPIYKTSERAGSLSTTGHSTNFIVSVEVASKKRPEHWVLNGAAFICSRKD
jgi:dynein heavy chain